MFSRGNAGRLHSSGVGTARSTPGSRHIVGVCFFIWVKLRNELNAVRVSHNNLLRIDVVMMVNCFSYGSVWSNI